jgi:hypothetical protein
MSAKRRRPEETWDALMRAADERVADEMERIASLSKEKLDLELAAAGFHPEAEGAAGEALAARLLEKRAEDAGAVDEIARHRARLARLQARRGRLSREELRARIARAKNDPRLPAPLVVQFRNRGTDEATDEELEAVLTELEALIEPDDGEGGHGDR